MIAAENLESERYRDCFVHLIHAGKEFKLLDASSKMNAEWAYLTHLKEQGQGWADAFLERHFDDLGRRSTFDLTSLFSDSFKPPCLDKPHEGTRRMIGILVILMVLGLLIYLAYMGISLLILAPGLAALAVFASGGGSVLGSFTQIFMVSTGHFITLYFPVFLLGASSESSWRILAAPR